MAMYPPPPKPQPLFVAIVDFLGFRRHLWNQESEPCPNGLENLYERYFLLLRATDHSKMINRFQLSAKGDIEYINRTVDCFVASDTVMLWSSENEVNYLIIAVANLVNLGLAFGIPLRGAIAHGECILEMNRRIFLGYPIVEAVEAEKCQEWVGIGVLLSAATRLKENPAIVQYPVPLKSSYSKSSISHAVAWHWAEGIPNGPEIRLRRMMDMADDDNKVKYQNAIDFVTAIGEG